MRKKVCFVIVLTVISFYGIGQTCSMFEIRGLNIYFYPVKNRVSYSKLNDTVTYSFFQISEAKYVVQKLVNQKITETKNYRYRGKMHFQTFKIRKRTANRLTIVKEKKAICLLEK